MNTKTALTVVMMTVFNVSLYGSAAMRDMDKAQDASPRSSRSATPTGQAEENGAQSSGAGSPTLLQAAGGPLYPNVDDLSASIDAATDELTGQIDNGAAKFKPREGSGTGYKEYVVDGATKVWGQAVTVAGQAWDGAPDTRTVVTGVAHGAKVVVKGVGAFTQAVYDVTRGATLERRERQVKDGLEAFGQDPEYQRVAAERAAAAAKIQALVRGHQVRKDLEQKRSAATKIQQAWRNHRVIETNKK